MLKATLDTSKEGCSLIVHDTDAAVDYRVESLDGWVPRRVWSLPSQKRTLATLLNAKLVNEYTPEGEAYYANATYTITEITDLLIHDGWKGFPPELTQSRIVIEELLTQYISIVQVSKCCIGCKNMSCNLRMQEQERGD